MCDICLVCECVCLLVCEFVYAFLLASNCEFLQHTVGWHFESWVMSPAHSAPTGGLEVTVLVTSGQERSRSDLEENFSRERLLSRSDARNELSQREKGAQSIQPYCHYLQI